MMQLRDGEYSALARMDRALVAELERRFRDENERELAMAMIGDDFLRLKADWDRIEGDWQK
jgi:hypothetical protein